MDKNKVRLWLFSDILVCTKPDPKKNKHKYIRTIALKTASFQDDDALSFRLLCTDGVFRCSASTQQEKDDWKRQLSAVIEESKAALLKSAFVDQVRIAILFWVTKRPLHRVKALRNIWKL